MAQEIARGTAPAPNPTNVLVRAIDANQDAWSATLAKAGMSWERFRTGILTAVRGNPKLLDADPVEVVNAARKAMALGLDVSGLTGEAYIVGPLGAKKRVELWKGVHGVAKLAMRSGMVVAILPAVAREGDEFAVDRGNFRQPVRHLERGGNGAPLAWYAQVPLATGGVLVGIVWRSEADGLVDDARARLGGAFGSTPWASNPEAMFLVAAVRRALKWAPKSVEQMDLLASLEDQATAMLAGEAPLPAFGHDSEPPVAALGHSEGQTIDAETVPVREGVAA